MNQEFLSNSFPLFKTVEIMFHFGFIWWEIEAEISLIQSVSTREKVTQKENLTTLQFWIIATRCSLQNMKVITWFKSRHKKIVSPWRICKEYKEQALNIKVHYFWSRKRSFSELGLVRQVPRLTWKWGGRTNPFKSGNSSSVANLEKNTHCCRQDGHRIGTCGP